MYLHIFVLWFCGRLRWWRAVRMTKYFSSLSVLRLHRGTSFFLGLWDLESIQSTVECTFKVHNLPFLKRDAKVDSPAQLLQLLEATLFLKKDLRTSSWPSKVCTFPSQRWLLDLSLTDSDKEAYGTLQMFAVYLQPAEMFLYHTLGALPLFAGGIKPHAIIVSIVQWKNKWRS